jgi:general secretion pathway protein I
MIPAAPFASFPTAARRVAACGWRKAIGVTTCSSTGLPVVSRSTGGKLPSESRESGFTLVEILVAFTIATILLAALLRGFSSGMSSSKRTEAYSEALIIADSTLEAFAAGGPVAEGESGDRDDGRFRVATSVHRYGTAAADGQYLVPYEMLVTVSWLEGPRRQSVALRSLRLAPQP